MSLILRERVFMSSLAEAQTLVRQLAQPARPGESIKAAMARAARQLPSWSFNRIHDVWTADTRIRVRADELDELRAAARKMREDSRDPEIASLVARLAYAEERLARLDAEFRARLAETLGGETYREGPYEGGPGVLGRTGPPDESGGVT